MNVAIKVDHLIHPRLTGLSFHSIHEDVHQVELCRPASVLCRPDPPFYLCMKVCIKWSLVG